MRQIRKEVKKNSNISLVLSSLLKNLIIVSFPNSKRFIGLYEVFKEIVTDNTRKLCVSSTTL